MESGNDEAAVGQTATNSSLAVAPVAPVAPHAEYLESYYEPEEWFEALGSLDEDSVCALEPRREAAAAAEEAAMEEDLRYRQMAAAMFSQEWRAAVRRMRVEQAHRAAAEAANRTTEPSAGL